MNARIFLLCSFAPLVSLLGAQTKTVRASIYFDNASYDLGPAGKKSLDSLVKVTQKMDVLSVLITGNTDNVGNAEFNKKLSEQRVDAARNYLVTKGLPDTLFKTSAFGETKPLTKNETEKAKQLNRRVDLLITYTAEEDPGVTIWDLYKQTEVSLQEFYIDNSRDTAIRSKSGTIIYIKANTFKVSPKCKNKPVTFRMKDDFKASDMILDNLSTTSNGRLLETQGMIYTEALDCNQRKALLNKGKDLLVYQPSGSIDPNAKIFSGNRTAHDSIMNWTLNTNAALQNFSLSDIGLCDDWFRGNCVRYSCYECRFFFCRIARLPRPFMGLFNRGAREDNRRFRNCQRQIRWNKRSARRSKKYDRLARRRNGSSSDSTVMLIPVTNTTPPPSPKCGDLQKLYEKYQVTNTEALFYALNKALLDSFQVKTMAQLQDTLQKLQVKRFEKSYENGTMAFEDYRYYVYNSSRLGWSNVDVFVKMSPDSLTKVKVDLKQAPNIDCKLVFKNRRYVIPATKEEKKYIFDKVPKGEKAWIVAIRYEVGQPMLYMQEIVIEQRTYPVEFRKVSLQELKDQLRLLDGSWEKPRQD